MLPGQFTMPGIAPESERDKLERLARAPLRAEGWQKACNVGLFSQDAAQLDLVDMARRKG